LCFKIYLGFPWYKFTYFGFPKAHFSYRLLFEKENDSTYFFVGLPRVRSDRMPKQKKKQKKKQK